MESEHFSLLVLLCFGVHMSSSEILHRQKRNWIIDSFEINEGYQGPFPYSLGKIQTEKTINLFRIHGQGVDEEPRGILKIDEETAEITVLGPVDHEEYKVLKLTFQAIDRDKNVIDTQLGIEIKIKDSNDNPPKFERRSYTVTIEERMQQDTDVITLKATDEDSTKEYKNIKYRIVSVTPQSQDLKFYITQRFDTQTGTISFKGCLDHEKAEKYRIIVEASDQGIPKALSSSCTVTVDIKDGNNHMPVITKQTGPGKVKEGEQNVLVSRLQVKDDDTEGTAAWRAKYYINGDTGNNFRITTDPTTNEGLLYVDKLLSFEDGPMRNITIIVENEIPYYTCKVVDRSVWKVETISGVLYSGASISGGTAGASGSQQIPVTSSYVVTVTVEDINEAPIFDKPNKVAFLLENSEAGQYLETFTARDPDVASGNTFRYVKGKDPADWISVDPNTGKVTTTKILDRESEHVVNSSYVVEIYAVDDGNPSMTSTATLTVQINDQNDNLPHLVVNTVDICQSDKPSLTSITASDKDEEPFGGPFRFKLHGDVKGKWKIEPTQGFSVNLVKDSTVHSGLYKLLVEVSDLQGEAAFHDLSVSVCKCIDVTEPNCTLRTAPGATAGPAVGIAFFSILVFAGLLLLAFLMTCRREKAQMPPDFSGQYLMVQNTEEQGTDCAVNFESSKGGHNRTQIQTGQTLTMNSPFTTPAAVSLGQSQKYAMSQTNTMQQEQRRNLQWMVTDSASEDLQTQSGYGQSQGKNSMETGFTRRNYKYRTIHTSSSAMEMKQQRNSMHKLVNGSESEGLQANSGYFQRNSSMGTSFSRGTYKYSSMGSSAMGTRQWRKSLHESLDGYNLQNIGTQINKKLYILEAPGEELGDYEPHEYIEEGDEEHSFELDAISIPDVPFDPDLDLDFRFSDLASVCMPANSTVSSTKSEKATVTQDWKVIKINSPTHL